jgi:hypothetical protein
MPIDAVIVALVAHARVGEIPEDGAKGPQPLNTEHHLIAHQWNDEEVHDECLHVNEELDVVADASTSHLVAVGDRHLKARVEDQLKM